MSDKTDLYMTQTGMTVDPKRFDTKDKFLFHPLIAKETRPLQQVLAQRHIQPDRDVIVAEVAHGIIVLDKPHMSYHHTAQGHLGNRPWLVCF